MKTFSLYTRFDCFVVWGHAYRHIEEILALIRKRKTLKIVHIERYEVKNISAIVNKIYSFDYAPIAHLKGKIKYLKKTPPKLFFVFVENTNPQLEYFGEERFRHIECLTVRAAKNDIRTAFNPRDDQGFLTHDHVVHATDNESQTDSILKLIGYRHGLQKLRQNKKIIESPFYIKEKNKFSVRRVHIRDLLCKNAINVNGKDSVKVTPIDESIQYQALFEEGLYSKYVTFFRGALLKQDYCLERFHALKSNFDYVNRHNRWALIIVNRANLGRYIIVDGLHRAALHLYQGNDSLMVCIYE